MRLPRVVAESHQAVERDPHGVTELLEVVAHHPVREVVDPGRDRGVGGEDCGRPHRFDRLLEAEVVQLHQLPDPLQHEEAGVSLVAVEEDRLLPRRL